MNIVWSPTALEQLDEIYDTIASERDVATASKWFFMYSDVSYIKHIFDAFVVSYGKQSPPTRLRDCLI